MTMKFSVSLWSIIHSYGKTYLSSHLYKYFPSPYGVSFILILVYVYDSLEDLIDFPSPYGVSFILILWSKKSSIAIYF